MPSKKTCKILHPTKGEVIPLRGFTAGGISSPRVGKLLGILTGDEGTVVPGITLREPPEHTRWLIYFLVEGDLDPDEKYTLAVWDACSPERPLDRVTGLTIREKPYGTASQAGPSTDKPIEAVTITIPDADGSEHCSLMFIARGTKTPPDTTIASATVKLGDTTTPAEYIFSDPDSPYWSAQFPILTDGEDYYLKVTGSAGGVGDRKHLKIKQEYCLGGGIRET
jgi:hypothetical protein